MAGFAQQNTSLTFTGINNTNYVQLDSIRIMNRAWDCDTVLHWPDTVLTLTIVGNPEFRHPDDRLQVFKTIPIRWPMKQTFRFIFPERRSEYPDNGSLPAKHTFPKPSIRNGNTHVPFHTRCQ